MSGEETHLPICPSKLINVNGSSSSVRGVWVSENLVVAIQKEMFYGYFFFRTRWSKWSFSALRILLLRWSARVEALQQ